MPSLMRTITNLSTKLVVSMLVALPALVAASTVRAAGTTAYGPYGPHIPTDTGFASLGILPIAGAILYGVGIFFILYSKFFQSKLVK